MTAQEFKNKYNMTEGYKVQDAPEEVARKEFDKLVASKVKKGYQHQ